MLRRDFIRYASLFTGGWLLFRHSSLTMDMAPKPRTASHKRISYHFHGDRRAGCASRPDLAPFLERGISALPPA